MHEKQLRSQPLSSRSTGTRLKQSIPSESYCSSLRSSELESQGTSVDFEQLLDDKQAFYEAKQAALDRIEQAKVGLQATTSRSSKPETSRSAKTTVRSEQGLANLDSAIGASRQSLQHAEGKLLRDAASQSQDTAPEETKPNKGTPACDPICRQYPVHHAAEVNIVEKKDRSGKFGKYEAVRGFKEGPQYVRRPRTQGYGIQMSLTEAQEIVESSRSKTAGNKENGDDIRSEHSMQSSTTNSFKPGKRVIQQRRRSSSVASAIGIGGPGLFQFGETSAAKNHSTGRTTQQELGGYAHPAEMRSVLDEKCTLDGAYHNQTKSDIIEYAEARIKFGALHNVI